MLLGRLFHLLAFVGSVMAAYQESELSSRERHRARHSSGARLKRLSSVRHLREINSIDPSNNNNNNNNNNRNRKQQQQHHHHKRQDDRTVIRFAQLKKREEILDSSHDTAALGDGPQEASRSGRSPRQSTTDNSSSMPSGSGTSSSSSRTDTTTSEPSAASPVATEYATVNYNGLIGINATDKYALTPETRTFGLPLKSQILMYLLYGTLAFTAIASNMIVCYIVLSDQKMRTATNYFIVNLAVGDILMALLCIPFTFIANLIYQYWPFGLSLCVIVSYAQANTVFISAYTMVAISIDKYLAIMYPMRLRMPKRQAKILILVIWSAALLTSLPTALLSNLYPASVESSAVSGEAPQVTTLAPHLTNSSQQQQQQAANLQKQQQEQQQQQQQQQRKYFCQESWSFWPQGRYIYSTALMILQYVLPLFVLVITYSRIVIVVWGKRIPGEEDNARDARMARSKRKMIKMVIFCVIAFALTWLPFNALIVIGDMYPEIWENQNIMYIWFVTHFLAMCHTITNPLIYIWMNNRFRAGFKQVFWDLYLPIRRLLAYLCYWCFCLGCLFACSRRKYSRVSSSLKRKQVPGQVSSTASGGGVNNQTNTGSHAPLGGGNPQTRGLLAVASNSNGNNTNNHLSAPNSSSSNRNKTNRNQKNLAPLRGGPSEATSGYSSGPLKVPTSPVGVRTIEAPSGPASDCSLEAGGARAGQRRSAGKMGRALSWNSGASRPGSGIRVALGQMRVFGRKRSTAQQGVPLELASSAPAATSAGPEPRGPQPKDPSAKRRRKKQSHRINIQMTTTEYRKPAGEAVGVVNQQSAGSGRGPQPIKLPKGAAWPWRKHNRRPAGRGCPECRRKSATCSFDLEPSDGPGLEKKSSHPSGGRRDSATRPKADDFIVDMHQSSQSTATISLLTNTTSLALSPMHSTRGANTTGNSSSVSSAVDSAQQRAGEALATGNEQLSALEQPEAAVAAAAPTTDATHPDDEPGNEVHLAAAEGQSPPASKAASASSCEQLRYMDETTTESSDNCRLQLTSQSQESNEGGASARAPPVGRVDELAPLSNSSPSSAGSGGASTDQTGEDQYCTRHRQQMDAAAAAAAAASGEREGGEAQVGDGERAEAVIDEENLMETDEDVCDVVFHDPRRPSRLRQLASADPSSVEPAAKCNGSLEMLSDQFGDEEEQEEDSDSQGSYDAEDEQLESLEAEFGDEQSPLRRSSFAMKPLIKPSGEPAHRSERPSNANPLLNSRTSMSPGELYASQSAEEMAPQQQRIDYHDQPKCSMENGGLTTRAMAAKRACEQQGNSIINETHNKAATGGCTTTTTTKDEKVNSSNKPTATPAATAAAATRAFEARERSLRRAMLLNNHLLSSLAGKMPKSSSAGHPVIKAGLKTKLQGDKVEAHEATSGSEVDEPLLAGAFCAEAAERPLMQGARPEDRHSCNGLFAQTPVGANGCDDRSWARLVARGSENQSSSSSAPASVTKQSTTRGLQSPSAGPGTCDGSEQVGQVLVPQDHNGDGRWQHHSLTSLSSKGPADSLKSLDGSLALGGRQLKPQNGTLAVTQRLAPCARHQLMAASNGLLEGACGQEERRRVQAQLGGRGGGDLIDRLAKDRSDGSLVTSAAPGEQVGGLFGGALEGARLGLIRDKQHHLHRHEELLPWTKSASTLVVRKSPTVYLISKTSSGSAGK